MGKQKNRSAPRGTINSCEKREQGGPSREEAAQRRRTATPTTEWPTREREVNPGSVARELSSVMAAVSEVRSVAVRRVLLTGCAQPQSELKEEEPNQEQGDSSRITPGEGALEESTQRTHLTVL